MSLNYGHSRVMGDLKKTNEKLKKNYSTSQYMDVLDTLLYNTVASIFNSTNYMDSFVSGILHHFTENGRRKISAHDKKNFSIAAVAFLFADQERKSSIYKKMKIERSLTNTAVRNFLEVTRPYAMYKAKYAETLDSNYLVKMKDIESQVEYTGEIDMLAIIREVNYWHKKYCEFKNMILQKYMRLITKQAQAYYSHNNSKIDLDDLIQNYVLYASKAIDKLDQTQGTLTSYIKVWLNHATNITSSNESGIAFVLPPAKRRECKVNNMSVPMDATEVKNLEVCISGDLENISETRRLRKLARLADPIGLARLSLGIQECLTKEEVKKQEKYEIK